VHIGHTFNLHTQNGRPVVKEKSCPAFKGQTAVGISMKLRRIDQYDP
jgi:hypothetical protein